MLPESAGDVVVILYGNPSGTFDPPVFRELVPGATAIAAADVDGNGLSDILSVNYLKDELDRLTVTWRALAWQAARSIHTAPAGIGRPGT